MASILSRPQCVKCQFSVWARFKLNHMRTILANGRNTFYITLSLIGWDRFLVTWDKRQQINRYELPKSPNINRHTFSCFSFRCDFQLMNSRWSNDCELICIVSFRHDDRVIKNIHNAKDWICITHLDKAWGGAASLHDYHSTTKPRHVTQKTVSHQTVNVHCVVSTTGRMKFFLPNWFC